jgi:hypothetical protein
VLEKKEPLDHKALQALKGTKDFEGLLVETELLDLKETKEILVSYEIIFKIPSSIISLFCLLTHEPVKIQSVW